MSFEKGKAVNGFTFALISRADGSAIITGTVNGFVTIDGGVQQALTNTPAHEGNGQWSVALTAPEMNGDIVGLLFTHVDAVPAQLTIATVEDPDYSYITGISSVVGAITYYGSIAGANLYFGSQRLNSEPWEDALANDRQKAMIMATRAIDRLNFAGEMTESDQSLQFPRGVDTVVPLDIELAAYECALKFLDGVDMQEEIESIGITKNEYLGTRSTYDASFVAEYIRAGIPSAEAWIHLKPYLRDPQSIELSRVS
jgi:hypothetical protein